MNQIRDFLEFLWKRFAERCRNIGYGVCRWNCNRMKMIFLDDRMCLPCWEDYIEHYK